MIFKSNSTCLNRKMDPTEVYKLPQLHGFCDASADTCSFPGSIIEHVNTHWLATDPSTSGMARGTVGI